MKKLEIIIKPEKLEDLKGVLDTEKVNGLNIVNSMGYGNQKGIIKNYRGAEYSVNLLPKIKVETVVADEVAPKLIDKIVDEINTGLRSAVIGGIEEPSIGAMKEHYRLL